MKALAVKRQQSPESAHYIEAGDEALGQLFALPGIETVEVLFVQHAEPDYDAGERSADPSGPPLSERGRGQSMRLAMRLRPMHIDAIYTSAARRSVETAAMLAAGKDMHFVRTPQLQDVRFDPEALSEDLGPTDFAAALPFRFLKNPHWDGIPGFEASREFRHRIVQAVEAIVARHPGERIVIVSHGSVINAYLTMILGIERDMFFMPEHTSISVARVYRDMYAVQNLNDFSHLLSTYHPR